jgi:hypothetical protein
VSFATEKMTEGIDSVSAALEAGFTRFRAVLMTALAMIIGMVPMALGLGGGGEQNALLGRGNRWAAVRGGFNTLLCPGIFQRSTEVAPVYGSNGDSAMSTNSTGVTRSPQIEDGQQLSGHPSPSREVAAGKSPHERSLYLAVGLIVVVALLATGIWSHVRAGRKLSSETAKVGRTQCRLCSRNKPLPLSGNATFQASELQSVITRAFPRIDPSLGLWFKAKASLALQR